MLNLYLNLATVLIAVYGIFYSLAVASEQSGKIGDIPSSVYTFGKVCWAMVVLLLVTTSGATAVAKSGAMGWQVWVLIAAYWIITGFLVWVTRKQVKAREPRS